MTGVVVFLCGSLLAWAQTVTPGRGLRHHARIVLYSCVIGGLFASPAAWFASHAELAAVYVTFAVIWLLVVTLLLSQIRLSERSEAVTERKRARAQARPVHPTSTTPHPEHAAGAPTSAVCSTGGHAQLQGHKSGALTEAVNVRPPVHHQAIPHPALTQKSETAQHHTGRSLSDHRMHPGDADSRRA
jgi:hypothetical protein